jgi:hypothetical protein
MRGTWESRKKLLAEMRFHSVQRATLFDKSPTANWLVVWHQDTALPVQERREAPGWGPWSVKDGVIYRVRSVTRYRRWT